MKRKETAFKVIPCQKLKTLNPTKTIQIKRKKIKENRLIALVHQ